jgi:Mg-chelatase subunit ChlD
MKKRGQVKVVEVILLLLIVFLIISVIFFFVLRSINSSGERAAIQKSLSEEDLNIDKVVFDNQENLTLTLSKGPGTQILINISNKTAVYEYNITVKKINYTYIEHNKTVNVTNSTMINVTNSTIVNVTNSTMINVTNSTIVNVTNSTIAYVLNSSESNGSKSDISVVSDVSGSMAGTKITETKSATLNFIDSVFNSTENKLGLVAYTTTYRADLSYPLSNSSNIASLKAKVNSWSALYNTCICCGINEAVAMLTDPTRNKVIVLMTDGQANVRCAQQGTPNATEDAIKSAKRAFEEYNITVYTVGFGTASSGIDEDTLKQMAKVGNGSYYWADIGKLSEIYSAISKNITWTDPVNISWQEPVNTSWIEPVNISWQEPVNISLGVVPVNISWQEPVNKSWIETITETWGEVKEEVYYENVTVKEYGSTQIYSYLKVVFYTEDDVYQKRIYASEAPPPQETREINLSVDPSWGITTEDLIKIEIYPVVIMESGEEISSPTPIATWEKPGFYSKR